MTTTQAWVGTSILTIVSVFLWLNLGYSRGARRSQAWAAVALLHIMWAIHLGLLHRETSLTAAVSAVVFVIIAAHRKAVDEPDSTLGAWLGSRRWLPHFEDRG